MITFSHKGNFSKTKNFLKGNHKLTLPDLKKFGDLGVQVLAEATPYDTGKTAESWYYDIVDDNGTISIEWKNSNVVDGVPIAVILQYGHATGTGGWVEGRDYINPAIQPVFDKIANDAWEEVTKL